MAVLTFAFIWTSKIARSIEFTHWRIGALAGAALCWSVTSSLCVYPHSLSYYNELVGGPQSGHYHLGNSNTDWGQDLFYLKRWLISHPEAQPLSLAYYVPLLDPKMAGIESSGNPPTESPEPGWHAVSANLIHALSGRWEYFLALEPAGTAGYSIRIFHVTKEQAAGWRERLK